MGGTLIVTVDPAWPPVSGAEHRNWQIAKAAAIHGAVRLLSVVAPLEQPLQPDSRIVIGALSRQRSASIDRRPWNGSLVDLTLPPDLGRRLTTELREMKPDYVIFEHLGLHPLLGRDACSEARVIFDLHNIESDLASQKLTGWQKWTGSGQRQVAKITEIERRVSSMVQGLWTCSSADAARIAAICPSGPTPQIVPNGIPRAEMAPEFLSSRDATAGGPVLLFIGHLCYSPNIVAAETLVNDILPSVQRRFPLSRVVLAGRAPPARIRRLQGISVEVVADPPDVTSLLKKADISVVPLASGGGTRIKIIEAMAWGVPVVGTRIAVEGLDLTDRVNVQLAETPAEFVATIFELYSDKFAYAAQREAAHVDAFRRFGFPAISKAVTAGLDAASALRYS